MTKRQIKRATRVERPYYEGRRFAQPCAHHEYIEVGCADCGWMAVVDEHGPWHALEIAQNFIADIACCSFPESEVRGEIIGEAQGALNAIDAAIADRSAPAPRRETGVARKGESGGAGTAIAQGQAMNP